MQPLVSIIIPVRNEATHIERVLRQVALQDYPPSRIEILVADGVSTDSTPSIVRNFRADPIVVRLISPNVQGRCQGLNAAIREARGDVILRLDARSEVKSDYVRRCIETMNQTGAWNVGGALVPKALTLKQEAIGIALTHPFGVGDSEYRLGRYSGFVPHVYLGCFRREVFDKVGLFDEEPSILSEDTDLNQRILDAGGRVYLDSSIKVFYYPRESFWHLIKLYFRYGGARAGNIIKHRKVTTWRHLVAPAFLAFLLSGVLGLFFFPLWSVYVACVVIAYLLLCCLATLQVVWKTRSFCIGPLVAFSFLCLHFSWATGFWKRLLIRDRKGTYWGY